MLSFANAANRSFTNSTDPKRIYYYNFLKKEAKNEHMGKDTTGAIMQVSGWRGALLKVARIR